MSLLTNKQSQANWSNREAFFDLFKRVARSASREDVHEHLRQIFKLFLDAFDVNEGHDRQVRTLLCLLKKPYPLDSASRKWTPPKMRLWPHS